MTSGAALTLYHSPNTRSSGALMLMEELGVDHELRVLDMKAGEQRSPAYLTVNPMGKVPALMHGDSLVTEQAAIYLYLADLFPEKGLAPPVDDPLRGPYLRWMVYYGSCFEPAIVDRAMERGPAPIGMSPYGDYDTMLDTVTQQLKSGPWLLGERYTAADVLWGSALLWTTMFKLVPETPEIVAYLSRFKTRPAFASARAKDTVFAERHAAAAAARDAGA